MKKSGVSVVGLLQIMLLAAAFAFASADASAYAPANPGGNAARTGVPAKQPHELECASFSGNGQRLHCHLKSTRPEATGPSRPLDDDQPALVAYPAASATHGAAMLPAPHPGRIPIAAPPAYILFGSFRS